MARTEEIHAGAVEAQAAAFAAAAAADAAAAGQPLSNRQRADAEQLGRTRAQDRADQELAQLLWLLERSAVEQKARDQLRWSAGDARPGEPCPTCGAAHGAQHGALPHQVADEQAEPGYQPCGCNPDAHDSTGPCVRRASHQGPCAAAEPDAGGGVPAVFAFACRLDDAAPHPAVT